MRPEELFIDRLTAVRHTLTAHYLSTKALDEALAAYREQTSELTIRLEEMAECVPVPGTSSDPTAERVVRVLADSFGCFWNAALEHRGNDMMSHTESMVRGMDAIRQRLEEHADDIGAGR